MKSVCALSIALFTALVSFAEPELPKLEMKLAYPNLTIFRPLWLCEAPDGTGRIFVAQQHGLVTILPKDRTSDATNVFLDLTGCNTYVKNEEGLLGFAFHPQFKKNGKFYVYYSQQDPRRSVISEFLVSRHDPNRADMRSERVLLEIPQPEWNHNGGQISFGPDGFLYIATGDGGGANDQFGNGQKPDTLLAKILRIDVNNPSRSLAYGIPSDNPFLGNKQFRPEIWAWGLRNPWRFSFDRKTGELYLGDVGQVKWEEVDIIKKGGNYGWNVREGFHVFTNAPTANVTFEDPILEYPHLQLASTVTNHSPGMSITGGYVYRGKKIPSLQGVYLYADFVVGTLWGLRYENGKVTTHGTLVPMPMGLNPPRQIASFGEDAAGEVYVLAYDGRIYELVEEKTVASK